MIVCKKCGNADVYTGAPCSSCGEKFALTEADVRNKQRELDIAIAERHYEDMLECYHLLADIGITEAEKEYAKILEKGQLTERNLDLAMKYFYKAAEKNDAYSAFRYSRLVSRENDAAARFWLFFSAVLGCIEAYPVAADEFSSLGYEEDATYFYYLAAISNDVDSIVTLAKRYMDGVGAPKSDGYAKWHMDKLRLPPFHAIKAAYKLRHAVSEEPPTPKPRDWDGLLRMLAFQAKRESYASAYLRLAEILADRGDLESAATVGLALIEGDHCKQNLKDGLELLTRSATRGSAKAHLILADLYTNGKFFDPDHKSRLEHLKCAGELGSASAYMSVAEAYLNGNGVDEDAAEAIKYFVLAGNLGCDEARAKADKLLSERELRYNEGVNAETSCIDDAFRAYAISASMGHTGAMVSLAHILRDGRSKIKNRGGACMLYKRAAELGEDEALLHLGRCYAEGIGVERDFDMARELLSKAERLGVPGTQELITDIMNKKMKKLAGRIYSTGMRLVHQNKYAEAKRLVEIASDFCSPKATYALGCFYEFGIGTKCDKKRAYEYYEKAASMKFIDTRSKYKLSVLKLFKI